MCLRTLYLLLQSLDLGVCIVNELVHLLIESRVLVGERLGEMVLVDAADSSVRFLPLLRDVPHLLRCLITIKRKPSASDLRNDRWAETAQQTCLVVFGGVEALDNYIIWIGQLSPAGRTLSVSRVRS